MVNVGKVLTVTGDITANNDNPYGVPYITQGILDLNGRVNNMFVTGSAANSLLIDSVIENGGINKTGNGTLSLGARSNLYARGTTIAQGGLNICSANALGTGPVTLGNGAAGNTIRLSANGSYSHLQPGHDQ